MHCVACCNPTRKPAALYRNVWSRRAGDPALVLGLLPCRPGQLTPTGPSRTVKKRFCAPATLHKPGTQT
eukprot:351734-Chlamydomonas_euryale.AAC.1